MDRGVNEHRVWLTIVSRKQYFIIWINFIQKIETLFMTQISRKNGEQVDTNYK